MSITHLHRHVRRHEPVAAAPEEATCRVEVFRMKRGADDGHYDVFDVPVAAGTSVLDALLWIKHHRDPTLALRHSCLHASCGTCGVIVNGREVLGCVTQVRAVGPHLRVEPLANMPILTDLVVDMAEFYRRFPTEPPLLRKSEFQPEAHPPDTAQRYARYEDCIECGLCLSACPVAATSTDFAGPAALVAAERLLEEPRGRSVDDLRGCVDRSSGAWRCHAAFECAAVCPAGVNPAERIMHLRGELLRDPGPREAGR